MATEKDCFIMFCERKNNIIYSTKTKRLKILLIFIQLKIYLAYRIKISNYTSPGTWSLINVSGGSKYRFNKQLTEYVVFQNHTRSMFVLKGFDYIIRHASSVLRKLQKFKWVSAFYTNRRVSVVVDLTVKVVLS